MQTVNSNMFGGGGPGYGYGGGGGGGGGGDLGGDPALQDVDLNDSRLRHRGRIPLEKPPETKSSVEKREVTPERHVVDAGAQVPHGGFNLPRGILNHAENSTREPIVPPKKLPQVYLALITPYTLITLPILFGFLTWKAYATKHSLPVANTLDWIIGIVLLVMYV